MKQVYVPDSGQVFDLWGIVRRGGALLGVIVNGGEFDTIDLEACVPYNGEMLPNVKEEVKPEEGREIPEECKDCPSVFDCFGDACSSMISAEIRKQAEFADELKAKVEKISPEHVVASIEVLHDGGISVNMRRRDKDARAAMGAFQDEELSKTGKDKESGK